MEAVKTNRVTVAAVVFVLSTMPLSSVLAADPKTSLSVDITPQPLEAALVELSKQGHLQLVIATGSLPARTCVPLHGSMSLGVALDRLLKDTGLTYKFVGDHTIAIVKSVGLTNQLFDPPSSPGASGATGSGHQNGDGNVVQRAGADTDSKTRGTDTVTHLGIFQRIAGALTFLAASIASAQNTASVDNSAAAESLSEVVVTARRVEERLQDVPISITVFNQEQVTKFNLVNASDLAAFTPSLSANSNFGPENSSFAIRGFIQGTGTAPTVGTYFADVVSPRGPTQGTQAGDGAGPGNFFDLQNVQVLMGPQGTLFGRNTTGGAVLFVPQKPTAEFGGYGEVSYGNYDMFRIQGALNLPLTDSVRFRLAVDHETRNGYINNISGIGPNDYNNVDYTAVRASLVLDLAANLENYTIATESYSDTNGGLEKLIACNKAGYNPVNPALGFANFIGVLSCGQLAAESARGAGFYDVEAALPDPVSRINQWQVINTTTWSPSDVLTVRNIASYAQYKDLQRSPLFATNWQTSETPVPYPQIFFLGVPRLFTAITPVPGLDAADQSTYTEELRVQGSSADQHLTYQGGVYLEWSDPLGEVGNESAQLAACSNVATLSCTDSVGAAFSRAFGFPVHVGVVNYGPGETRYRDQGVYTQESYAFTDQWKLTGGARYTWDSQATEATHIGYTFPVEPPYTGASTASCTDPATAPSCTQSLSKHSGAPTWLIDLDYKPRSDILTYAKYARGYRAGGVVVGAPVDHQTFEPEKLDDFEVGLKSSFQEVVHGTFDANVFYSNLANQQLAAGFGARVNPVTGATAPVSPTTAIVNAGKSRIYGAEVDATLVPFPGIDFLRGLKFEVNYTYLNATIREISLGALQTTDPNYQGSPTPIRPGTPLWLSPRDKYVVSGEYTLPLGQGIGRITLSANVVHTDQQLTTYDYLTPSVVTAMGGNYGTLPASNLLNLNLSWQSIAGTPLDLSIFATNVTQEHYYLFVPGLDSSGSEFAALGQPRMYGARLRYSFGK
jgi:iron complex outermembrane receptor protein